MSHVVPLSRIQSALCELSSAAVDLLVVPWFEDERADAVPGLDAASGSELSRVLATGEFTGRLFDTFLTPITGGAWTPRRLMLVGAGQAAAFDPDRARKVAAASSYAVRARRVPRVGVVLRCGLASAAGDIDVAGYGQAVAEGLTLGEFVIGHYKSTDPEPPAVPAWTVVVPEMTDTSPESQTRVEAFVDRGRVLGQASNLARELANEPGNLLTPRAFAAKASAIAADAGVKVEVLDEGQLEALGMGLLLGVARGSSEPPRLMVFTYEPAGAPAFPTLGLVGKGVTFDTGGISIKPADGMDRMKSDMTGGAAVTCAMWALATLGAPVRVVGVVPAVENMPGGRAIRPGDVLKSAEGRTVEVLNTDAEGRLILGDALWYARQRGASHLVDVATLTGAIVVALGKLTTGLFGTPDAWTDQIRRVADREGDRVWPMPLIEDYRDQLKSEIADTSNVGGRSAGSITAALFLRDFTGGLPWAHLDIAGTAWAEESRPYQPKGPTGVAVRTLVELAFSPDRWPR